MHTSSSLKLLIASISFSFIAGCSSVGGGSQSGDYEGSSEATETTDTGATSKGTTRYGVSTGSGSRNEFGYEVDELGIPVERTIYFSYDSDTIDTKYSDILNGHANYLKKNPNANMTLQGHTDNRGTREYNMALGERRANAIERFMTIMEVPRTQMSVVSYGEERPAVRGNSENDHAMNRRVVLDY